MDSELRHRVEDFFYLEAELLDERRLREWLELFTDDVHYWMPVRYNPLDRPKDLNEELSGPGESYYFNDNKATLRIRVERFYSKSACRNAAFAHPPSDFEYSNKTRRRYPVRRRFKLPSLPDPHGEGRGYFCRHKKGQPAAGKRRTEDRPAKDSFGSGGSRSKEYQRFSLRDPSKSY